MKLSQRDRRALAGLGIAAVAGLVYWFSTSGGSTPAAAQASGIPSAERRLARLRQQAATVAGKQKTISVHLTVSGVVPRRLVPDKKGVAPL